MISYYLHTKCGEAQFVDDSTFLGIWAFLFISPLPILLGLPPFIALLLVKLFISSSINILFRTTAGLVVALGTVGGGRSKTLLSFLRRTVVSL